MNILRIDTCKDDAAAEIRQLRERLSPDGSIVSASGQQRTIEIFGEPLAPQKIVERVCQDIKSRGLAALLEYSKKIDNADLTAETLRVPPDELEEAHRNTGKPLLEAVKRIRSNIIEFQSAILHKDIRIKSGVCDAAKSSVSYLAERYRPLKRIGICVPGGAAAYPSTVLMTAVPAQVAGVKEIAVMAPPTKFGAYNTDMLAVCYELGISEVYRMGGAQGVAALAYLYNVDKIVGPGNLFVALAKRYVFGTVGIDSIAGPSEVVVIVDETTNPLYTAYDLLAQAEHSPGVSILISWNKDILANVLASLEQETAKIGRGHLALQALDNFGAAILCRNADEACQLSDAIAPEHLHIAAENAEELAEKVHCAGAIFLGQYTPVAAGDYAAGPSHVLPTSGTARFTGGLTCNDFLRASSVMSFDKAGLQVLAEDIAVLADKEGLTAHRDSVLKRLENQR